MRFGLRGRDEYAPGKVAETTGLGLGGIVRPRIVWVGGQVLGTECTHW